MSGKGSRPRPYSVDQKTFESNWDKIFGSSKENRVVEEIAKLSAEITLDETELEDPDRVGN